MWESGQLVGVELLLLLSGGWGFNSSAQPGNRGFYTLSPFAGPKASGSLSVLFKIHLFIHIWVFSLLVCHAPCANSAHRGQQNTGSSGSGVSGTGELRCGCWESNLGP